MKKIEKKLKKFPLVLHGASSINQQSIQKINELGGTITDAKGVPEEILTKVSTKHNICKINVDSDIRMATTLAIKEYLNVHTNQIDPRKYLKFAQESICSLIEHKIVNVFKTKPIK